LDVFFEAGHIVSNAPVLRLGSRPAGDMPDEARVELTEAAEGGAEYFILALLDYDGPVVQASGTARNPPKVSLRLFTINPYKKIFEQQYSDNTIRNVKDEFDNLKTVARGLVSHLQ
jgi:hypothetical protein